MTLRQFEYFITVVDEGSITKAANRLYVAQPSLSKQLASLEKELGVPLLERLPRGIRLTPAGKAFLPEARAAVLSENRARRAARMAKDLQSTELEVATLLSISVGLLPAAIGSVVVDYPGISLKLYEFGHHDLMEEQVRGGVGDLAVGPPPQHWDGPVEPLGWEEFVVLFPPDDPALHTPGAVDLADLSQRRWVLPEASTGLASLVVTACRDAGFDPIAVVRSGQVEALVKLVGAGLGPTILPTYVVPENSSHLSRRCRRPLVREVTAYTRHDWPPGSEVLLGGLRSVGLSPGPPDVDPR
ncbi:hypothetical protein A5714_07795 [Mycobacterium sp. E2462]|uniref:LysR family transcriptional regulator n=1 Tax=Mycobacterium sp. E2462 TaxID=1834133 RepID=UPI0007FDF6D7|nr:LysR family transcriptional regulator [Mycobacterium sp. E2462]OBI20612.1 hypothetical protein A5714_07795 [Mycobacterium sp. E2462]